MSNLPSENLCAAVNLSQDGVNPVSADDTKRVAPPKPLNIMDLNDDCLHQIFNSNYVSVMDLALVAQSCVKWKKMATEIFTTKYKVFNINNAAVKDFVMAEQIVETFGLLISDLRIDFAPYGFDGTKIVDAILRNCKNLKSLAMASYQIPDTRDEIAKIALLFGKVEVLHINDVKIEWPWECAIDDFVTPNGHAMNIFENCNSLINLKIENCPQIELVAFGNNFPKLQHVYYGHTGNDVGFGLLDDGCIAGFILRHRKIKSFKLTEPCGCVEVLSMFSVYCKELENLEFRTKVDPNGRQEYLAGLLNCLGQLNRLKELKIVWRGQRVTSMLKEFHRSKSLSVLHLESVRGCRDLLRSLSGIKTLRCVKLVDVKLQSLATLAGLTELTELFIEQSGDIESGFDIVKLVNGLIHLRKLKIHFENYSISQLEYVRLTEVVECRVGTIRCLEVDCNTTGDFTYLLCRSVQFKKFEQ